MFPAHISSVTLALPGPFVGLETRHIAIDDVGGGGGSHATFAMLKVIRSSALKLNMRRETSDHATPKAGVQVQWKAFRNESIAMLVTIVIFIVIIPAPIAGTLSFIARANFDHSFTTDAV